MVFLVSLQEMGARAFLLPFLETSLFMLVVGVGVLTVAEEEVLAVLVVEVLVALVADQRADLAL
jgi:hypothetical protein